MYDPRLEIFAAGVLAAIVVAHCVSCLLLKSGVGE